MNHKSSWPSLPQLVQLLRQSLGELLRNDPLRMAGATAFFTTFALPPILVILIQLLKLVLHPRLIRAELFQSLSNIVGPEAVAQLTRVLAAFRQLAHNGWVTAGGFVFLLFIATTLFIIIKNSINQIWKVKPLKQQNPFKKLRTRAHAVAVILVAGFLFFIGVMAEGAQAFIGRAIFSYSPLLSFYFNTAVSHVFSLLMVLLWFAIMFRYLPDARPCWPVAFVGGAFTALLFSAGKYVLKWLLAYSNINTFYGTSASVVLLLLFVFYTSLILYFGAAFTKVWAVHRGRPIAPLRHAVHYQLVESPVEEENGLQ